MARDLRVVGLGRQAATQAGRVTRLLTILALIALFAWLLAGAIDQELASGSVLAEREVKAAAASPRRGTVAGDRNWRGNSDRPSRSVSTPSGGIGTSLIVKQATYQGRGIRWWAARAVQNKKDANARGRTIRRLKDELRRKYAPSFEHYFTIAALTYNVDRAMLERKGRCESVNFTDFYNETPIHNGEHASGVMGFIPSTFRSTPYGRLSVFDHLANIMAGAWMHARGRGREWACR